MRVGLEVLPDDYRRNIIIWVCAIVALAGFLALLGKRFDWQKLDPAQTCPHCLKVHAVTGIASALADGIMLSALLVVGIEPFCAALRSEAYPPLDLAIVALIAVAALVTLTLLGFILRLPSGARSGSSRGDLVSSLVTGTRVVSVVVALWMFTQGFGRAAIASRMNETFGSSLGQRLQHSIGAGAIRDALVVLLVGCILSALSRWLVPLIAGSKPLVFMAQDRNRAVTA